MDIWSDREGRLIGVVTSIAVGVGAWFAVGLGAALLDRAFGAFLFGEALILPASYLPVPREREGDLAVLAMLAGGLLYGLLLRLRLPPLGPALVGVGYVGVSLWAMADPESFQRTLMPEPFGLRSAAQTPAWGYAMLMAPPLLLAGLRSRPAPGWPFRSGSPDEPFRSGSGVPLLLLAPVICVATGVGVRELASAVGVSGRGEALMLWYELGQRRPMNPTTHGVLSAALLLTAGILFWLALRSRPPVLAMLGVGVIYVAASAWAVIDPDSYGAALVGLSPDLFDRDTSFGRFWIAAVRAAWGYTAILGGALLVAAAWELLGTHSTRAGRRPIVGSPAASVGP